MEHIEHVHSYLSEMIRLLSPNGVFIVSVPNKKYYLDKGILNDFHFNEMYYSEFKSILEQYYENIIMYYQPYPVEFLNSNLNQNGSKYFRNLVKSILPDFMLKYVRFIYLYIKSRKNSVFRTYKKDFNKFLISNEQLRNKFKIEKIINNNIFETTMGNFVGICEKPKKNK
jgi:ubiquinone/menaquinone biosynthesis C-methylase UbiE